jgi:hypothetical protein
VALEALAVLAAPADLVALAAPADLVALAALVDLEARAAPVVPVVLVVRLVVPVDPEVLAVHLAVLVALAADRMPCVSRCWTPRGGRRFWTIW